MREAPFILIGAGGMLGRAMHREMEHAALPFRALGRDELDLTDADSIATALHAGVRFVINCAAWTDVDGAESAESAATLVNGRGVELLAQRCGRVGAMLVTYGTDYVFSGDATEPYRIDTPRAPLNAYGRSKAAGEEALEASNARWLHIRTSWLYAPWGKNFVRTIRSAAMTRPELKVVSDQRGRPTSAEHLARATLTLIDHGATGHLHVTDGGECSWHEFATEIRDLAKAKAPVHPCTSADFPRPAKRPAYSVLDIAPAERLLGPMPHWRENLAAVMEKIKD